MSVVREVLTVLGVCALVMGCAGPEFTLDQQPALLAVGQEPEGGGPAPLRGQGNADPLPDALGQPPAPDAPTGQVGAEPPEREAGLGSGKEASIDPPFPDAGSAADVQAEPRVSDPDGGEAGSPPTCGVCSVVGDCQQACTVALQAGYQWCCVSKVCVEWSTACPVSSGGSSGGSGGGPTCGQSGQPCCAGSMCMGTTCLGMMCL